jgi:hypothetical protein
MSIIQGNAKQASTRGFYSFPIEQSLRFNDDDSAYLSWTPDSAGNRKTWTYSFWVKRGNLDTNQYFLDQTTGSNDSTYVHLHWHGSLNTLRLSGYNIGVSTNAKFRDPSAWYHVVFAIDTTQATDTNRIKIYVNGVQQSLSGSYYTLNADTPINATSLHRIGGNGNLDGYLAEVNFIDGTALGPTSFGETKNGVWIPKDPTGLTYGTNGFRLSFADDAEVQSFNTVLYRGNNDNVTSSSITGTGFTPDLVWIKNRDDTNNHFLSDSVRGPSRMLSSDTTSAESYSSSQINFFDSDGFTVGNSNGVNDSGENYVAWCWDAGANNAPTGHSSVTYSGNQTDNTRISGLPFRPDLVWIKERDSTSSHQLYDSVRGADNGLRSDTTAVEFSLGEFGGFDKNGFIVNNSNGINQSGQTYVAWAWDAGDGDPVSNTDGSITATVKASTANGFSIVRYTGDGTGGSTVGHGLSSAPEMVIVKTNQSGYDWPVYHVGAGADKVVTLNLTTEAQQQTNKFNDTAPSSTVVTLGANHGTNRNGNSHIMYCFHSVSGYSKFGSYTGTGSTGLSVTTGFRPGWLMIKNADSGGDSDHWSIVDGSRSPFDPQHDWLFANGSFEESTNETNRSVTFTDTGFTINSTTQYINNSGDTFIYAAFKGSYSDYITDYNTDGSIDSRVKANTTTGFSIVSYEGTGANATVGHGLDNAPEMIIARSRDSVSNWGVYHSSLTATDIIYLNLTNASGASSTQWNDTEPTSSVFSLGSGGQNKSGEDHIAYCWSQVSGYSSFGSYTGNGSTSGPSVTTGFKPSLIMIKRTDTTGNWIMSDTTRDVDGTLDRYLLSNSSDAEGDTTGNSAGNAIDVSDTGFQLANTNADRNASGGTYIYAAFADTREAAFWLDQTSNDNDWQPVNLDHNDTVADSPTNNFCVFNPLKKHANTVFSDGNLKVSSTDTGSAYCQFSTIVMPSGKYYAEFTINTASGNYPNIGIGDLVVSENVNQGLGDVSGGAAYQADGRVRVNGSTIGTFPTFTVSDVIGVAYDADNNRVYFAKNGTWINSADPVAGTGYFSPAAPVQGYVFASSTYSVGSFTTNFGQQPFKYGPPS